MEHLLSVNTLLQSAKDRLQSLAITFIGLRNAFGSISHKLLLDMLPHIKAPEEFSLYISNLYSNINISTYIYLYTKDWSTPLLKVHSGILQGDTHSPILFLLAFNPIIQFSQSDVTGRKVNTRDCVRMASHQYQK